MPPNAQYGLCLAQASLNALLISHRLMFQAI